MNNDTRFANQYNIQWFPGHMTKTLRMMETEIQHVDASLVLLDARIPLSSLNPEVERITARKPKLYVLNKADLADPAVTEEWIRYFRAADAGCVAISAKQKGGAKAVQTAIERELASLLERRQNRGMGGAKTQVMLCGIPNVGKSTFINTFAGSARAKAADRPGVTKGKQWVSTEKFDLLDMPGVLWKKFDSKTIASNLAFIGSIKDDILDVEELAMNLLDEVRRNYPDLVAQRYKLDAETLALPPYELLEAIGRMERDRVKMEFFGDLSPLSQELRDLCEQTRRISKRYDGCQVNICLNYGGRDEILRAARAYALDCVEGRADPNHLTQENFSGYLFSRGVPDPDLIIRPSGGLRLSNFLLWESAYAEFYFTDVLWPDFSKEELHRAIAAYQSRSRRFGGV